MKPTSVSHMPLRTSRRCIAPFLACLVVSRLSAAPAADTWPAAGGAVFAVRDADVTKTVLAFDAKGRKLLAFDCAPRGRALVGRFHEFVCDGGSFHPRQAGAWVGSRVSAEAAFTMEATITPAVAKPAGTGAIIAYADGAGEDAAIVQTTDGLAMRLRGKKILQLFEVDEGKAVHVVVAVAAGRWQAYRDGRPAVNGSLLAEAAAWGDREIVFGSGTEGGDPWRGRLETIAVFPRALTSAEAAAEAAAAAGLRADRPAAAAIRFRGTLHRQADTTDVKAMLPYTRSLTAAEYTVEQVVEGEWTEPTITVLHWMVLDGTRLPIADRKPGTKVELVVEPLGLHPQLESCRRDELLGSDQAVEVFYSESEHGP